MFRLIRLALLVGVGYMIYEFFQGLKASGGLQRPQRESAGPRRIGAPRASNPQNMTGPGQGRRIQVDTDEEEGSEGHAEVVGRGVVRR